MALPPFKIFFPRILLSLLSGFILTLSPGPTFADDSSKPPTPKVKKEIKCGMTKDQVKSLFGDPIDTVEIGSFLGIHLWRYGGRWVKFHDGKVVSVQDNMDPLSKICP